MSQNKFVFPTLDFEQALWDLGFSRVAGLDEVGRGCFAGPVVVGAVIFDPDSKIPQGITDSKLLKPRQRDRLAEQIKEVAQCYAIAEVCTQDINHLGIGKATQKAFRKAIKLLDKKPDYLLIDAFYIKHLNRKYQKPIIKGDQKCLSIAAASILAKVYRDKVMKRLAKKYPEYGFAKHKGYGTKAHQEAIRQHGLCRIHRKSFNLEKFLG